MTDDLVDLLVAYSEWLDSAGLVVDDGASGDDRSHEELVSDFLDELDE